MDRVKQLRKAGSHQLLAVCVVQFSKMIPHGGEPQRFGNLIVMLDNRSSKEAPEFFAFAINYSQFEHYPRERRGSAEGVVVLGLCEVMGRTPHRIECPLIILMRSINGLHDRLITLN